MAQPPEILVCFAVKEEARPFMARTADHAGARTLITGMGRRNADHAVRAAITAGPPRLVISAGFAGGLDPNLDRGAILFEADPETGLVARLSDAGAIAGRFHCADRVAVTAAQKQQLRNQTGADAVEMESSAIRAVCVERRLPCATVRVILDTAAEDLPLDFNALMTSDMRLDTSKLALALATSPGKIAALLRFQRQARAAADALAQTLWRSLAGTIQPTQAQARS